MIKKWFDVITYTLLLILKSIHPFNKIIFVLDQKAVFSWKQTIGHHLPDEFSEKYKN